MEGREEKVQDILRSQGNIKDQNHTQEFCQFGSQRKKFTVSAQTPVIVMWINTIGF